MFLKESRYFMKKFLFLLAFVPLVAHAQPQDSQQVIVEKCSAYAELSGRIYSLLSSGMSPTQTAKHMMAFAEAKNIPDDLVYDVLNKAMRTIQHKTLTLEQFVVFETGYCVGRMEAALGQQK